MKYLALINMTVEVEADSMEDAELCIDNGIDFSKFEGGEVVGFNLNIDKLRQTDEEIVD